MAEFFDSLTPDLTAFIEEQPVFFTASAAATGRVNLSPKGMDTFRVLSPVSAAYLDLTGSGNETAAHLKHDGRLTIMFNSFTRRALILRLYGKGRVVRPDAAEFATLIDHFPDLPGSRQIIILDIDQVQTSCGYGVPEMALERERPTIRKWAEQKGADGLLAYQEENNRRSIDGFDTGL